MKKLKLGMLLFPDLTVLDFVGPYDVFIKSEVIEVLIIGETTDLIKAEGGLILQADLSIDDCPDLDIIFIPGGKGINRLLTNQNVLSFLRDKGQNAKYITSVCTGSLILAAAGLLNGYKATTHWRSLELLRMFGIETITERVVIDRNRITGGGVTSGIDFGLVLISILAGENAAKLIQLQLEYNPSPPYNAGSPETIEKDLLEKGIRNTQPMFAYRKAIIESITKSV